MADHETQATLRVVVEGADQARSDVKSVFDELNKAGGTTAKSISIDTSGAAAAAGESVKAIGDAINTQTKSVTSNLDAAAEAAGRQAGTAMRSYFDQIKAGFAAVDWSTIAGGVGGAIGEIGSAVIAVGALGAAIGALGIAAAAVATTVKLMSDAMGYAQDLSAATIKNAGRAARAQTTLGEAEADSAVGVMLLGKGYDRLNDTMTRSLTDMRLGKGGPGDKDLYSRLGMTPETMTTEGAGRVTVLDLMERFSKQYADLQKQAAAAPAGEKEPILEQMKQLRDDVSRAKGLGPVVADTIATSGAADYIANLKKMKAEAPSPLADDTTLVGRAQALSAQLFGMQQTFQGLKDQMGEASMQPVADFFNALRTKANEIGPALAQLGGAMAAKGWEAATTALQQIDVKQWVGIIQQWQSAVEGISAEGLATGVGEKLNSVVTFLRQVAQGVTAIMNMLATIAEIVGKADAVLKPLFNLGANMRKYGIEAPAGSDVPTEGRGGYVMPLAPSADKTTESLDKFNAELENSLASLKPLSAGAPAAPPAAVAEAAAAPAAVTQAAPVTPIGQAIADASNTGATSMRSGIETGGMTASSSIQTGLSGAGAAIQAALVAGGQSAAAAISGSASAWGAAAAAALRAGIAGMSIPVAGGGGAAAASPSRGPDNPVGAQ